MTPKDPFTPSKSQRESEKELAKGIKETISNIKENFHFASAFAQCEWVLIGFMIWYRTWKKFLLTKVHSGLLVSKQFFQVEHSIIGQYHKTSYTGIGSNDMAKFIYYQILANTLILKLN